MKFNEYVYLRPDFDTIKAGALELIEKFSKANDVEEQLGLIKQFNADRFNVMTANVLCSIRHSINTKDEFYESENNYWDQQGPLYEELTVNFYKALLESPFIEQLQAKMPQAFFKIVEFSLKSFDPKIIEDLQEENRLSSEYQKLIASAQIEFDGKVYTLPQLTPLTQSTDRSIRKRATDA
ncbi:MAG: M3 family oligoendopeptidase, partial [Erysipelotrichaceae bacterium]|nr:M3 family oligoendopeptidase [Erysipelotrichaceae bacterium]